MNPLSKNMSNITINIKDFNQDINLFFRDFNLVVRVLIDQIVHFLRVDSPMVVQLFHQVLHVCSNVVMETYVRIPLYFCLLKLFPKLLDPVYVLALLWWLYVFYDAPGKVSPVNLPLLLFEHHELKPKQLLDDLSAELYHLFAWNSIRKSAKHTFDRLLDRLHEICYLRLEISWLKSNRLLNETVVIPTHIFQKILISQKVHFLKSFLSIFPKTWWSSKNFSIFFL